jgi:PLD-like domain
MTGVAMAIAVGLALGMTSGPATGAATSFSPAAGGTWNNPRGAYAARNVNMTKVRNTIDSVPRNGAIRIALYSYNRRDIGNALMRACRRHVSVQMVLNDNAIGAEARRMIRYLGRAVTPKYRDKCHPVHKPISKKDRKTHPPYPVPSFFKVCKGACRLGGDISNQHMKFYLFSQTGSGKPSVMFGSNNLMSYAANVHWNDLYTVNGNQKMYDDFTKIFLQMSRDHFHRHPYWKVKDGIYTVEFGSDPNARGRKDHVWQRLNQVKCTAPKGYGESGHTKIRIMMYGWVGDRGYFLARKVAALSRAGCHIRVLISGADRRVRQALTSSGVGLRSAAIDLDRDPETGFADSGWEIFSHEKWMSLNGSWGGHPFKGVWTGSENWSGISLHNDEVTVQVPKASALTAYNAHFDNVWYHYTRGIYDPYGVYRMPVYSAPVRTSSGHVVAGAV